MEGAVAQVAVPPPVPDDAVRIAARLRALAGKRKVIMFTSAASGEGSGAVAASVAMALAQMDLGPVLLVDANFPSPGAHRPFALAAAPGLVEVLAGEATLERAAKPTGIERLSVLPLGTPVAPGAVLRTLAGVGAVIAAARARFECVVVDAPSFVRSAAASVVIAQGDGVVLVVGAGAHKRRDLVGMRRELEGLQARLLGVVLSGPPQ